MNRSRNSVAFSMHQIRRHGIVQEHRLLARKGIEIESLVIVTAIDGIETMTGTKDMVVVTVTIAAAALVDVGLAPLRENQCKHTLAVSHHRIGMLVSTVQCYVDTSLSHL